MSNSDLRPATISAITFPISGPALIPKCELPNAKNAFANLGAAPSTGSPSGSSKLPNRASRLGLDYGDLRDGLVVFVDLRHECPPLLQ